MGVNDVVRRSQIIIENINFVKSVCRGMKGKWNKSLPNCLSWDDIESLATEYLCTHVDDMYRDYEHLGMGGLVEKMYDENKMIKSERKKLYDDLHAKYGQKIEF